MSLIGGISTQRSRRNMLYIRKDYIKNIIFLANQREGTLPPVLTLVFTISYIISPLVPLGENYIFMLFFSPKLKA